MEFLRSKTGPLGRRIFPGFTALADLLGVPADKVNPPRLYRALDQLLPHKEALETHLKNRLGTLFDLDYDLLLYDVWNKEVIDRRVGQIMAKHSRAAGLYEVAVEETDGRAVVSWRKNEP